MQNFNREFCEHLELKGRLPCINLTLIYPGVPETLTVYTYEVDTQKVTTPGKRALVTE